MPNWHHKHGKLQRKVRLKTNFSEKTGRIRQSEFRELAGIAVITMIRTVPDLVIDG